MWGRRKKRGDRLSRQLALGLLEDAMGHVQPRQEQQEQERHEDEPEAVSYPSPESGPAPPARTGLQAADVPLDNSAPPDPAGPADDPDPRPPPQRQLPAPRTGGRTRRRSFGLKNHSHDRESAVSPQPIIRFMVLTGGKDSGARPTCLP
jgi:hypothetical protein